MKPIYRQTFEIEDIHLDRFDRVKPSVLLYFAQEVAVRHCTSLSLGWEEMHKKNLMWVITRQKIQITRMPQKGDVITLETWTMPTTRVAYPRSTVGYDQDGNELFRAISIWVLVDTDTRNMILPGKSGIVLAGTLRGLELPSPRSLMMKPLASQCTRIVTYSMLDKNGHMNNTRYMDWIFDLLPSDFHRDHPAREITICYLTEALEGQEIDLSWELADGSLTVDAHRKKTEENAQDHRIFSAQVLF